MRQLELKIPPVAVFLLVGLAMWFVRRQFPQADFHLPYTLFIGGTFVAAGLVIAIAGVIAFRRHQTTVLPHAPERASAVVSDGVFRFTRNPMYLGLALVLVAWAVKLGNLASLAGIPVFVVYMTRFQIQPEERALSEKFGTAFDDYMKSVRRWL